MRRRTLSMLQTSRLQRHSGLAWEFDLIVYFNASSKKIDDDPFQLHQCSSEYETAHVCALIHGDTKERS